MKLNCREAPADLAKEAKSAMVKRKKKKNVKDTLEGSVGRLYVEPQDVSAMALAKHKGVKRERRDEAAARKAKRVNKGEDDDEDDDEEDGDDDEEDDDDEEEDD